MRKIYKDRLDRLHQEIKKSPDELFNFMSEMLHHPTIQGHGIASHMILFNPKRFGKQFHFEWKNLIPKTSYYVPVGWEQEKYFGFKNNQYMDLCYYPKGKDGKEIELHLITKKMALKAIRRFINTGEVYYDRPNDKTWKQSDMFAD